MPLPAYLSVNTEVALGGPPRFQSRPSTIGTVSSSDKYIYILARQSQLPRLTASIAKKIKIDNKIWN